MDMRRLEKVVAAVMLAVVVCIVVGLYTLGRAGVRPRAVLTLSAVIPSDASTPLNLTDLSYVFVESDRPVVYSGDFNGDGERDIALLSVSSGSEKQCGIYYGPFNISENSFITPSVTVRYRGPLWAEVYDYDGDGADELFLITVLPRSGVWMIRGGLGLPSVVTLSEPSEFGYGSVFVGHGGVNYDFSDVA
ncbi:hypothetical protein J7K41_03045, partial [Candidatus Micrarchaeota archaeon]|nr:hypothetical protein [Candidatus Micrarchaeota archaeon]